MLNDFVQTTLFAEKKNVSLQLLFEIQILNVNHK